MTHFKGTFNPLYNIFIISFFFNLPDVLKKLHLEALKTEKSQCT